MSAPARRQSPRHKLPEAQSESGLRYDSGGVSQEQLQLITSSTINTFKRLRRKVKLQSF